MPGHCRSRNVRWVSSEPPGWSLASRDAKATPSCRAIHVQAAMRPHRSQRRTRIARPATPIRPLWNESSMLPCSCCNREGLLAGSRGRLSLGCGTFTLAASEALREAPLLFNTSFNLFGEPLVVKPRDAVRSYFCSGIDALVIDNFVLSKTPAQIVPTSVSAARAS